MANGTGNTSTANSRGPSGLTLLTITFVVLKALGYLHWSWLWVFAPMWIPAAVVAALFLLWAVTAGALTLLESRDVKKRRKAARELGRYADALRKRP